MLTCCKCARSKCSELTCHELRNRLEVAKTHDSKLTQELSSNAEVCSKVC